MSTSHSGLCTGAQQGNPLGADSIPVAQGKTVGSSGFGSQTVQRYLAAMNGNEHVSPYQQGSKTYQAAPPLTNTAPSTSSDLSSGLAVVQPSSRTLSAHDVEALLDADLDEGVKIDIKDLCSKVSFEITERSITQMLFSDRILHRRQGTFSELLKKPKPWNGLKNNGRRTYIRMHNWLSQPLEIRMAMLAVKPEKISGVSSSTPAKRRASFDQDTSTPKKTRLIFTEIQKLTLEKLFDDFQRPCTEMIESAADHLGLEYSTVFNFFQNARRRTSRVAESNRDEQNIID